MEMTEREFFRQVNEARNIESVKLKEWTEKAKPYLPHYVCEYLFHKNTGVVSQMLQVDPEQGFVYDPTTLKEGVDMLMKVVEGQMVRGAENARYASMYTNFADPQTRVGYLRGIVDYLDIYPTIGEYVVKDMLEVAKTSQDEEYLELLDNRIRNIETRTEMQKKELQERLGRQPQ